MINAIFVRVMMNMKVVNTAVKIRLVLSQITTELLPKQKEHIGGRCNCFDEYVKQPLKN